MSPSEIALTTYTEALFPHYRADFAGSKSRRNHGKSATTYGDARNAAQGIAQYNYGESVMRKFRTAAAALFTSTCVLLSMIVVLGSGLGTNDLPWT